MYPNGQWPSSALSPVGSVGQLKNEAAAGWNAMRLHIYEEEGVWISPNGPLSTYRTYSMQVEAKKLYGSNAATPGTSNHGLADTVDTDDHYLIGKYGVPFGFSKAWSDAAWEPWHLRYQPGHYDGKDPGPDPSTKPPKPGWWKKVGNRIEQARERRLSKKQRRKQTHNPERREELHKEIAALTRLIDRLTKRRDKWGER